MNTPRWVKGIDKQRLALEAHGLESPNELAQTFLLLAILREVQELNGRPKI